jgi:magnesium-protoporphyrin O-methyltransferase
MFTSGDMLSEGLGTFDHVMAMDSMIYYTGDDLGRALAGLAKRVSTPSSSRSRRARRS